MARRAATEATAGNAAHAGEVVPNARAAAVFLHVDELRPNPRNPRMHGPEVLKLARTILRTAWGAPIVAQARSRRIIGGHGRLEAAKEILAGIEVDGELRGGAEHYFDSDAPAPGMVPVRLVDVSDAEADAMTLADNAHALQGRDDGAAIVVLAAGFGRSTALMADIGLSDEALDRLVHEAGNAMLGTASPGSGTPAGDASSEWEGMPDYESDDHKSHRSIVVHFASDADFDEFARVIGATFPGGSKSTWYPPQDPKDPARAIGCFSDREYTTRDPA